MANAQLHPARQELAMDRSAAISGTPEPNPTRGASAVKTDTTASGKPRPLNVRGRTAANQPNPVDIYFGKRLRLRREILGLSQMALAKRIKVTFQQVQKYEKGDNRVGWSRACDIADVLGTSLDYFRQDMDDEIRRQSPMRLKERPGQSADSAGRKPDTDPMTRTETLELVEAYYSIYNRNLAANILCLLKTMAHSNATMPHGMPPAEETFARVNQLIEAQPMPENGNAKRRQACHSPKKVYTQVNQIIEAHSATDDYAAGQRSIGDQQTERIDAHVNHQRVEKSASSNPASHHSKKGGTHE